MPHLLRTPRQPSRHALWPPILHRLHLVGRFPSRQVPERQPGPERGSDNKSVRTGISRQSFYWKIKRPAAWFTHSRGHTLPRTFKRQRAAFKCQLSQLVLARGGRQPHRRSQAGWNSKKSWNSKSDRAAKPAKCGSHGSPKSKRERALGWPRDRAAKSQRLN